MDTKQPFYWLNDDSRTYLSRGYLSENETPESRVRDIAERAEKYLDEPGYADKFYEYMSRGYYSLSSPVWANYGKERGLPVSCLTGDSWIQTEHEGGTQIKNLKIGDKVLTHKHRYRPVTKIMTRQSENDLYNLKVSTMLTDIKITGNHPVLTNLGWVRVDELDDNIHLIATNASEIERDVKDHTMVFDQYNTEADDCGGGQFQRKNLSSVDVDEDVAWAFGLWFGDRHSKIRNGDEGAYPGIAVTGAVHEREVLERFGKIFEEKFGLAWTIEQGFDRAKKTKSGETPTWLTVHINSCALGDWVFDNFGGKFDGKNIPRWLKNLPAPLLRSFYKGFYQADGRKGSNSSYITIANPRLAMSLFEVGLSCGFRMGLQMQEKASKLSPSRYVYRVVTYCKMNGDRSSSFNRHHAKAGILWSDGLRYCPFKLAKIDDNETVWDITVEEDHSFSVSGVVVHNCFGSYIDDHMESIMYGVAENGMLMKNGGGCSGYFGAVRGRGAPIKDSGESSGSVHFMQIYDTLASVVSQGSVRRGFFAAYQDIEHPDADEFLDIGTEGNSIQGLTTSVVVSDQFIKEMKAGDPDKRRLWAKVLQRRSEIGYPYIMFGDNVNNNKPQVYKDKDMRIHASQMCLRGDSIITVKFPFEDQPKDTDIETFCKLWGIGGIPAETKVKTEKGFQAVTAAAQTGSTKEMIRITDDVTGKVVECTPDHKIFTQNRGWVEAQDLTEEDELLLE